MKRFFTVLRWTAVAVGLAGMNGRILASTLPSPQAPSVLVLYDNLTPNGWSGALNALQLKNQLNHFNVRVTRQPVGGYASGGLAGYSAVFYLGSIWEHPVNPAWLADVGRATNTVVWLGHNLGSYAYEPNTVTTRQDFVDRYGFSYLAYSEADHPRVWYKDTPLMKDPFDPGLHHVRIEDPSRASVVATGEDQGGTNWPYIIRSGTFWFVGDMPLIQSTFSNRSLAFADLLHDMLGQDHPAQHLAYIRIEDVSPVASTSQLALIGTALADLGIPFLVSLIPEYHDCFGVFNHGIPVTNNLTQDPLFVAGVKRMLGTRGQVLQHGTTHQADGLQNPFSGVTAADYEFFRVITNAEGATTLVGPIEGDSAAWARQRGLAGKRMIRNAGLATVGWLTPHYLASPTDYEQFALLHPQTAERAVLFVNDYTGGIQYSEFYAPYPYRDTYGLQHIPETIGYIDPAGWPPFQPPSLPSDLIARAQALKVVRDAHAGAYFHWYLDPSYLRQVVTGLQAIGFTFAPFDVSTLNAYNRQGAHIESGEPASTANGTDFGILSSPHTLATTLILSNSGTIRMEIDTGTWSGVGTAAYNLGPLPSRLDPGSSTTFTVSFSPTTSGSYPAQLILANDSTQALFTIAFTGSVLFPAPLAADFDGDGRADPALYEAQVGVAGRWSFWLSASGYARFTLNPSKGGTEYTALAGDFDGDRLADPTLYQTLSATWIVCFSSTGYTPTPYPALLGGPGLTAFCADFDGDGKADPGDMQSSLGIWCVMLSTRWYNLVTLGGSLGGPALIPVPGDYDGDGWADPAVHGMSGGDWIVALSSLGYDLVSMPDWLGGPDFRPMPGDFDSDGKTDPAVLNPVTGEWQVRFSSIQYPVLSGKLPDWEP